MKPRVAVLGAGAAGLSAARGLHDAGLAPVVLEASERVGGRVRTDRAFAAHPVELGAEFVHGEDAATWRWIRELELATFRWGKQGDSMVRLEDGAWMTMTEARATRPDFDQTRSWNLPDEPPLPNESWRSYLVRIGFTPAQLRYVKRSWANACGESMRFLSAAAMLEALAGGWRDKRGDYRVLSGYDAVVTGIAAGLDVRTEHPVTRVERSGRAVGLTIADREQLEVDAVVVTAPVGVLQSNSIDFAPELPEGKRLALRGLRMGPVIKLVYRFATPILPPDIMAVYSAKVPPMWWSPSFGHPAADDRSCVWTGFVSGDGAMDLLALEPDEALERALDGLEAEIGERPEVLDAQLVSWPDEPWIRGGYSVTLPGHEGARALLAEATPPVFWAGEATAAETGAATVHGAIDTGVRAAGEVQAFLRRDRRSRDRIAWTAFEALHPTVPRSARV